MLGLHFAAFVWNGFFAAIVVSSMQPPSDTGMTLADTVAAAPSAFDPYTDEQLTQHTQYLSTRLFTLQNGLIGLGGHHDRSSATGWSRNNLPVLTGMASLADCAIIGAGNRHHLYNGDICCPVNRTDGLNPFLFVNTRLGASVLDLTEIYLQRCGGAGDVAASSNPIRLVLAGEDMTFPTNRHSADALHNVGRLHGVKSSSRAAFQSSMRASFLAIVAHPHVARVFVENLEEAPVAGTGLPQSYIAKVRPLPLGINPREIGISLRQYLEKNDAALQPPKEMHLTYALKFENLSRAFLLSDPRLLFLGRIGHLNSLGKPIDKLKPDCKHTRTLEHCTDRMIAEQKCFTDWKQFCDRPKMDARQSTAPAHVKHATYLQVVGSYKFNLCIHGGGLDPDPAVWESLTVGTIPIIQQSSLSAQFSTLPVVVVSSLDAITPAKLDAWWRELSPWFLERHRRLHVLKQLTLAHWVTTVRSETAESRANQSAVYILA